MSGQAIKILLAGDNNPSEFENLIAHLQTNGFKVISVENRDSIVTMTHGMAPDLILLDLESCFDICRMLKRNFVTGSIPIIALLFPADEPDRIAALELGVDDCMAKPYHFRELLLRIRCSLNRARERMGRAHYQQAHQSHPWGTAWYGSTGCSR